jgi:hypothetical protein
MSTTSSVIEETHSSPRPISRKRRIARDRTRTEMDRHWPRRHSRVRLDLSSLSVEFDRRGYLPLGQLTLWESLAAIKVFAGVDIERAKYYDEDQDFLLEFEPTVTHYEVCVAVTPIDQEEPP